MVIKYRNVVATEVSQISLFKGILRGIFCKRRLVISLGAVSLVAVIYLNFYLHSLPVSDLGSYHPRGQAQFSAENEYYAVSESGEQASLNKSLADGLDEPGCNLPELDPFHRSILRYVQAPKRLNCSVEEKHPRASPSFERKEFITLFEVDFNSNLILLKNLTDLGFGRCCYKNYSRINDYEITDSDSCILIESTDTKIPPEHEFIMIYCSQPRLSKTGKLRKHYKMMDMLMLTSVQLKPKVEERIAKFKIQNPSTETRLNVLVLGLDAVSHMNLKRNMPLTYKYLTEDLSALGMNGYTKVGDNTFPNIVPALTGLSVEELRSTCWINKETDHFDGCPFIWKNFSTRGYRTSYAEDAVWMGIFNYRKLGFLQQPTDYDLRTLTFPLDSHLGHTKRRNSMLCYGPRLGFSVLLENIKKMAAVMGTDKRYFQFTWATSLFHDNMNDAVLGDEELRDTLKWLNDGGHLNNAVLILMSDHGPAYGSLLETYQGRVEARMPFLYYSFPKWFSIKYASAVANMKLNGNRLTTPFDFYETLNDLLKLGNIEEQQIKQRYLVNSEQLPRGISLFLPVPLSRNCESAGINEHFCVCHSLLSVSPKDEQVRQSASAAVAQLNKLLSEFPQCSILKLEQIRSAYKMDPNMDEQSNKYSAVFRNSLPVRYTVLFSTVPGNGMFEATLNLSKNETWTLVGDISRINIYGTQSRCVTDYHIKKYCFCQ